MSASFSLGPLIVLAMLLAAALAGTVLFWRCWRGKRIDDHPLCRRCRYDLTGTPKPRISCPECGAALTTDKALIIGNRKRRTGTAVIAGLATLASAALLVLVTSNTANNVNLNPYKPLWWLRIDARDTNSFITCSAALDEIGYRIATGKVSEANFRRLWVDAIAVQTDVNRQWIVNWGDIAWDAIQKNRGTTEQYQQYGENMVRPVLHVRQTIRQGQPIPIALTLISDRGFGNNTTFQESHGEMDLVIDGHHVPVKMEDFGNLPYNGSLSKTSLIASEIAPLADLSLGMHEVSLKIPIRITAGNDGAVIASWDAKTQATFELIANDAGSTVRLIHHPAAAAHAQSGIRVEYLRLATGNNGARLMSYRILFHAPRRYGIAHEVYADDGKNLWFLGVVNAPATSPSENGSYTSTYTFELKEGFEASLVDLILTPSTEYAEQTVGITELLDHEFIIKDVQVVYQP